MITSLLYDFNRINQNVQMYIFLYITQSCRNLIYKIN